MASAIDERIVALEEENAVLMLMVNGLREQRRVIVGEVEAVVREIRHLGAENDALRSMLPQRPATHAVMEMLMQASSSPADLKAA